jgi:L-rhamnose mutarotase
MQCKTFHLRIREDRIEEYDEAHPHVWPEPLVELQSFGVRDYSIFGRGQELFLYLRVSDFNELVRNFAASELSRRWYRR